MGRKTRNKISKNEKKTTDDKENKKNELENKFVQQLNKEKEKEKRHETFNNLCMDMLDYCNTNNLPLCEYLNIDSLMDYVDHLETN